MKRLLIFGSIFGFGLLLLVLVLGPGRIVRDSHATPILSSNLADVRPAVAMKDPSETGSAIGIALEGAGTYPMWKPETLQPDGSLARVKAALLHFQRIEPFIGGFHFATPHLDLYPGKRLDERPATTIDAGGGDLATRTNLAQAAQLSAGIQMEDIKAFTLSPAVVIKLFDPLGGLTFTLETERLEAPETPLDLQGHAEPMSRLNAPLPVHFWRADGTLDVHAGGMELDRVAGRLTLQPPIVITGTELSMPGFGAGTPASAAGTAAAPVTARPPMTLTSDGPATFVRRDTAPPAAVQPTTDFASSLGLDSVLGPGELVFTQNVLLRQGKPEEHDEQWLRTDRLALTLDRDALGQLTVRRLDGGVPQAPLTLGLLGGDGHAQELHWNEQDGGLVLDGPIDLQNLVVGEGASAKKLKLTAAGRLVARKLPADATFPERLPERLQIDLTRRAHVEIPGELAADGEQIVAELLPPVSGGAKAGSAAVRLLSVLIYDRAAEERAAPDREPTAREVPGVHDVRPLAIADLTGRGTAHAHTIRLTENAGGARTAHLDGDARADFDRGFVAGATLDVVVPADPALPTTVIVPLLTAGEIVLPKNGGPFEARSANGDVASGDADTPRRLVIEPLAACSLTRRGDASDLLGRCRYRVRSGERDTQLLLADELHLTPDGVGGFDGHALGAVELTDDENGLTLAAASARTKRTAPTEHDPQGRRLLYVEGAPACARFTLPDLECDVPVALFSAHLELDLDSGAITADDAAERVRVELPEPLLAELLPQSLDGSTLSSLVPPDPDAPPLELQSEHLVVTPAAAGSAAAATSTVESPKSSSHRLGAALRRGTVTLRGRVHGTRPTDGSTLDALHGFFDLAHRAGRLEGSTDAPVVLQRAKPYAADRIESITTAWIDVKDGGENAEMAAGTVFVLYPEDSPTATGELPKLMRVELRPSDPPQLIGKRLALTGGVDIDLTRGDDLAHAETARARSERAELLLSRGLGERGLGPIEPLRLNATQRVLLDYGAYHGQGNLLSYRFVADPLDADFPEPGVLELRKGVEPCTLLGQDDAGGWHATAHFISMKIDLATSASPSERTSFKGFSLIVEPPLAR